MRQPGDRGGRGRRQVADRGESGEDVVGSDGRCDVAYDQSQYRTRPGPRARAARGSGPASGPPRPARASKVRSAVLGHPGDLGPLDGEERRDRRLRRGRLGTPGSRTSQTEASQPVGEALRLDVRRRRRDLDQLEHVEVVGQRGVQRGPQPLRVAALGQPDLEVLGLAGDPGRRRAGVADLRVRGEPAE